MITFRPSTDLFALRALDRELFPLDDPPEWATAHWFIGWDDANKAAFCGWKKVTHRGQPVGFHYRAGVRESWRGRGVQCDMLQLREAEMRRADLLAAVTYTDADNAASMCNLIAEGYRPYCPDEHTLLSGAGRLGRCGFVHWRKELT